MEAYKCPRADLLWKSLYFRNSDVNVCIWETERNVLRWRIAHYIIAQTVWASDFCFELEISELVFVSVYHFKNNKMGRACFFFFFFTSVLFMAGWRGRPSTVSGRLTLGEARSWKVDEPGLVLESWSSNLTCSSSIEAILSDSFIWHFPRSQTNVDTENKANTAPDWRQEGVGLSRRNHERSQGRSLSLRPDWVTW